MDFWPPLYLLIEGQRKNLGITKPELARRCGCQNTHKGICWINAISRGFIDHHRAKVIMERLPAALEIDQADFDHALAETQRQITEQRAKEEAEREAEMRARFKPHGYLITERSVPTQITICGLTGGPARWLRIELDLARSPVSFAQQAVEFAKQNPTVPFFGKVESVIVNYSPDSATRFDLDGNPVEMLDRAYGPGQVTISIGGRDVGPLLQRAMGL